MATEHKSLDEDEQEEPLMLSLSSSDEDTFTILQKAVRLSKMLSSAIEMDPDATELDVSVSSPTLQRVVQYLTHYVDDQPRKLQPPLTSTDLKEYVDDWDAEFVATLSKKDLYDLLLAANYMDIQPLLHLCCAKVATYIKGKPIAEMEKELAALRGEPKQKDDEEMEKKS